MSEVNTLFSLPTSQDDAGEADTGKTSPFLTFEIGARRYAIPMSAVRELVEVQPVTKVHDMPEHILGIINLRGHVVPVIDASLRLGLGRCRRDDRTCVIILDIDGQEAGVMVERIGKVYDVVESDIEMHEGPGKSEECAGMGSTDSVVTVFLHERWLVGG